MIKNWRNKVGLFLGSIISWLPQKYSTAGPSGPTPDIEAAFTVFIKRDFKKSVGITRTVTFEVEQ